MASQFNHELLRQVRLELDLSQEQLADELGIDVRTYRRYESGAVNAGGFAVRRGSQRKLIRDLCEHLGFAESDLVVAESAPGVAPRGFAPRRVHSLPAAARFVGRAAELARLAAWLDEPPDSTRVIAIVGMGGTGKSSLLGRALSRFDESPLPYGVFVWSFYENPRTEDFLREVIAYLGHQGECSPGERDRVLLQLLASGPPHLLVLDGLELVQADAHERLARGELLDPALRRLLVAIAEGRGQSRALITTRFRPIDLEAYPGGYLKIDLGPLSHDEALELLRAYEVTGDVTGVVDRYGGHPLSVAMVASYAREFLGGDCDKLALDLTEVGRDNLLARRLVRLLESYAQSMSELERDLMARMSLFASGVSPELLAKAGAPPARIRVTLERLRRIGILSRTASGGYTAHPFVRDHFRSYLAPRGDASGSLTLRDKPSLPSPDQDDDVLIAVFERTLAAGELEAAFEIYQRRLGGFGQLGLIRGDMVLGERLVRAFAAGNAVREIPPELGPERSSILAYDWGLYLGAMGELDAAIDCYEAAIDYVDRREDVLVAGLRTLAYVTRLQGELERSLRLVEASVDLAARHDRPAGLSRAVALRGRVLHDLGRIPEAAAAFARFAELGDEPVARRGVWLAEHRLELGDVDGAISLTERNLAECERRRWAGHVAHCHLVLGRAHATRDPERARHHLSAVDRWTSLTGEVELVLAGIEARAELDDDETAVRAGFELARRTGYRPSAARLACRLLESALDRRPKRLEQALETARRAVGVVRENALIQKQLEAIENRLCGQMSRLYRSGNHERKGDES